DLKKFDFGSLRENARAAVIDNLKTYQRIQFLTNNSLASRELVSAGYTNALALSRERPSEIARRASIPQHEAAMYRQQSAVQANTVATVFINLQELHYNSTVNTAPSLPTESSFFAGLRGYEEMFGNQTTCNCRHCQSMLSPAAYFVDLMYFIEKH